MKFITWFIEDGISYYFKLWKYVYLWINHNFAISTLIKSLFSPWKRTVVVKKTGMDIKLFFDNLAFSVISRLLGFTVRIILILTAIIQFVLVTLFGSIGLILWVVLPFLSLPIYWKLKTTRDEVFVKCLNVLNEQNIVEFLKLPSGKFLLTKLNVNKDFWEEEKIVLTNCRIMSQVYLSIFESLSSEKKLELASKNINKVDFENAGKWWEERHKSDLFSINYIFGRPGIGVTLLYGFTPTLDKYSEDLAAPTSFSDHLIGRNEEIAKMERALSGGKQGILVVGQAGVGKTTIVLGFARKLADGQLGKRMSFRRVLQLDTNFLLSESHDLNEKKALFSKILLEAKKAGNIIIVIKDLHRLVNAKIEGVDYMDIFEEFFRSGEPKFIAISNDVDYERFLANNQSILKYFSLIEVAQPNLDEAMRILFQAADKWEAKTKIISTAPALRQILEGSEKYITQTPFPEKAIELLDEVILYVQAKGGSILTWENAMEIISDKTGISLTKLTQSEKDRLSNLEEIIHRSLVNQEHAVKLIAQSLRSRSMGVKDENRPVGSFLFLGPTGVGKTETAKVLAKVYYGKEENVIRFNMAEYAGKEGIVRLIGSADREVPGELTNAIKNNPSSLILLDELEKSTPEVLNILLALLDEGEIKDALGRRINAANNFIIATSNAGSEKVRQLVNSGIDKKQLQAQVVDFIQKANYFSPELLNRFDGVVVFEPLSPENLVKVAQLMLEKLSFRMKSKNIHLEFDPEVAQKLAKEGYEPAFGARPMRRIVDLVIGDLISKALIEGKVEQGKNVRISVGKNENEYFFS